VVNSSGSPPLVNKCVFDGNYRYFICVDNFWYSFDKFFSPRPITICLVFNMVVQFVYITYPLSEFSISHRYSVALTGVDGGR